MTQISPLTKAQIITMFESLIDDSLDATLEGQLLNQVKDTLEAEYVWAILNAYDSSSTATSADTYLTTHALPTDFGLPSPKGIYVGSDLTPWVDVPFLDRERYQSIPHRYYIDYANSVYALCGGANPGGTIKFYYQKTSPWLSADGDSWIFPNRFHPILPYLMAIKFYAIDQGDKSRAYDDRWDIFAKEMKDTMIHWNARLQKNANANAAMAVDITARPDVIDIDQGGQGIIYG